MNRLSDAQKERLRLVAGAASMAVMLTIGAMSGTRSVGGWVVYGILATVGVGFLLYSVATTGDGKE